MDIQAIPLLALAADNIMKAAEVSEFNGVINRCAEALEAIRSTLHLAIDGFEPLQKAVDRTSR